MPRTDRETHRPPWCTPAYRPWIKVKDHRGPFEIRKLDLLALSIRESQRGRFGSYFEPVRHEPFPFESFGLSGEFFPTRGAFAPSQVAENFPWVSFEKRRKSPRNNLQSVETRQIFSRFIHASLGNLVAKWFLDPLNCFYGPRVCP